jgi:ankyrin repeat protein
MPTPVTITYTNDLGEVQQADNFSAIMLDDKVSVGFIEFKAPGIKFVNIAKHPLDITERPDSEQIYQRFSCLLDILYTIANKSDSEINRDTLVARLRAEILTVASHAYYFQQAVFMHTNYSIKEKQKMFKILNDDLGLDLLPIVMLVIIKQNHLTQGLKIFGAKLANYKPRGDIPLAFSYNCGNFSHSPLKFLRPLWSLGGDPNQQHPIIGNLLHQLLLDFEAKLALIIIDELLTNSAIPKFDFAARNANGDTLLLLAIKTRQITILKKLFAIYDLQAINIGLNIKDNEGRTPMMLAAALGFVQAVVFLQRAKADVSLVDNANHSLSFYMHASSDLIRSILASVNIEWQRDRAAQSNWLNFNDKFGRPVTNNLSRDPHKRVLLSLEPSYNTVLSAAFKEARDLEDKHLFNAYIKQNEQLLNDVFAGDDKKMQDWLENGIAARANHSIFDICLSGQELVRNVIQGTTKPKLRTL